MRLLHTADWHLGQELYGFDRAAEHAAFLEWLVDAIADADVDAVLVAGDIFHSVNPPMHALRGYYRFLRRVGEIAPGRRLIVIGGNHDSAQRLELPLEVSGDPSLHVVGALPRRDGAVELDKCLFPIERRDGEVEAVVAAIPYLRPGDLGAGETTAASLYRAAVETIRRRWPRAAIVLMGHLHVAGGAVSALSERRILIGGEEAVGVDSFPAEAAYVALGHLHRPQTLSTAPLVRYSGSPIPLSASERDYRHAVSVVEIVNGEARFEERAIPRWTPFLRAPERGALPLDELEAALRALEIPPEGPCGAAFLEVAARLDTAEPELRARILAAIGDRPVRLGRILRESPAAEHAGASTESTAVDLSPSAVFDALHRRQYGAPPPPALRRAFDLLLAKQDAALRRVEDAADGERPP